MQTPTSSPTALAALIAAAVACGNSPAATTPPPERGDHLDRARLDHVSVLLRGRAVDDAEWQRWTARPVALERIASELASDPFVARRVAATLIFRNNLLRPGRVLGIAGYALKAVDIGGKPVLTLGRPCKRAHTVDVRPWWDPDHPVKVCRDAVRAEVWERTLPDGSARTCNALDASPQRTPDTPCGCGPNLIRCWPPGYNQVLAAEAIEEVRATTAHVVATRQPLARLFTMNETWRTREVERFYRRNLASSRQVADPLPMFEDLERWPAIGQLAAREEVEPGQHAGVITAPHTMYNVFDPRQRMRIIYEGLWCSGESAPGARPEDLLSLHTAALSTDNAGWEELAARPYCTDCHARLDYGMQFFLGYRAPLARTFHYVPTGGHARIGPLYAADIRDPRGTAPLTPRGFAELATRQPEFARCMASNVASYITGARTDAATIARLAGSVPADQLRLDQLIALAVVDYLRCDTCRSPATELTAAAAPAPAGRAPELAALVDQHCTACHTDDAAIPSFAGPLDLRWRTRVLDQALSGRMPPRGGLSPAERRQFLAAVAGGGAAASLRDPRALLAAHADPPRALPLAVAREHLRWLAGGDVDVGELNALEFALDGKDSVLTPNQIAFGAIAAYRSCAGSADVQACAERALDAIWGAPHQRKMYRRSALPTPLSP